MQHVVTVDSGKGWYEGPLAWLLRKRWIFSIPLVKTAFGIAAGYLGHWVACLVLFVLAGTALAVLLTIRTYWLRRFYSDDCLHGICHMLRDSLGGILLERDYVEFRIRVERFNSAAANRIAGFFVKLTGDQSVNCAIRIAEMDGEDEQYATRGRSDGMDPGRPFSTQPVPGNEGIAAVLRRKNGQGVLIVRSISEAVEAGAWYKTVNDGLPDVTTLMVAPINGMVGSGRKGMLGILYVTSAEDPFRSVHTLPLKAFADILGMAYPLIADKSRSFERA